MVHLRFIFKKNLQVKALESNWLPAPDGPFYATMRLYGPEKEALEGKWLSSKAC
jgi:hypothetical protein